MPLKSRRFCASQYFDCILLCGLYIGLHYTIFFEICTSWNPTGRPVAGLKHGFQGSQAVNSSHHFVALKCSLEPPSNIARHSPRHHLYRAFPSKQKTTACWRSACRKKLAGLQCHHLRSCQHSIRRTFLSEKSVQAKKHRARGFKPILPKKFMRFLQLKLNGNWSAYLMELDQFSEVVMNVSSQIAWGDHQGQRMLPSQEEVWVASINRK